MDIDTFWQLIDESLRHSPSRTDRQTLLRDRLALLSSTDIVQFQAHLDLMCASAYTWDLWGAAMRIFGGWCSDDGFVYFRLWLVGRGREVFERAVAEPDALAELPEVQRLAGRHRQTWSDDEEWPEWESLDYIASHAYRQVAEDDESPEDFNDALSTQLRDKTFSRDPAGKPWDARDEVAAAQKVPTLSAMFRLDAPH